MKAKVRRKQGYETAARVNITLPPKLHQELEKIVRLHGFAGPSDYVQARIRLDAGLVLAEEHDLAA